MASRGPFQPQLFYNSKENILKKNFRLKKQLIKTAFYEYTQYHKMDLVEGILKVTHFQLSFALVLLHPTPERGLPKQQTLNCHSPQSTVESRPQLAYSSAHGIGCVKVEPICCKTPSQICICSRRGNRAHTTPVTPQLGILQHCYSTTT